MPDTHVLTAVAAVLLLALGTTGASRERSAAQPERRNLSAETCMPCVCTENVGCARKRFRRWPVARPSSEAAVRADARDLHCQMCGMQYDSSPAPVVQHMPKWLTTALKQPPPSPPPPAPAPATGPSNYWANCTAQPGAFAATLAGRTVVEAVSNASAQLCSAPLTPSDAEAAAERLTQAVPSIAMTLNVCAMPCDEPAGAAIDVDAVVAAISSATATAFAGGAAACDCQVESAVLDGEMQMVVSIAHAQAQAIMCMAGGAPDVSFIAEFTNQASQPFAKVREMTSVRRKFHSPCADQADSGCVCAGDCQGTGRRRGLPGRDWREPGRRNCSFPGREA